MTLIVGIRCSDGIVLGADGAATLGSLGQQTIRQEASKLDILEGRVVVGVSGPVGLGQRIKSEIQTLWLGQGTQGVSLQRAKKPTEAMVLIRTALWEKHLGPELKIGEAARGAVGNIALQSALTSTVVALPVATSPCLIQFDHQGAPEEATVGLPFVSIGSGQSIADPFLAFLRRIFWPQGLPTLNDGIFTALWTLEHAILTNAGGVSDPKQIMVLENTEKRGGAQPVWKARQLQDEEFEEHMEAIHAHEDALADYHKLKGTEPKDDLRPPSPA